MKFKKIKFLEEDYLIEKYQVQACKRAIDRGRNIIRTSTRGNGVAVFILVEIYNKITGSNENSANYILHHKNGEHDDNTLPNLVLINITKYSHQKLHSEVMVETSQAFFRSKGYSLSQINKLRPEDFEKLSDEECIELGDLYNKLLVQIHKEKHDANIGVILMDEIIK